MFKVSRTIMGENSPDCPYKKRISCLHLSWQPTSEHNTSQSLGTKRLFLEYKRHWIQTKKRIVALFYYTATESQLYSRCIGKSSIDKYL